MTIRNLKYLFQPRSIAVIGASKRPYSVGATVLGNVLHAGFGGAVYPVNPKHESVCGLRAFPDIASLPSAPDLAIICTPPLTVPDLIGQLGAKGTRAAIVLTAGLSRHSDAQGRTMRELMLGNARCNILACWLGGESVAHARRIFSAAGVPTYDTPEKAVDGFMQMVRYQRNQKLLMEAPAALTDTGDGGQAHRARDRHADA